MEQIVCHMGEEDADGGDYSTVLSHDFFSKLTESSGC